MDWIFSPNSAGPIVGALIGAIVAVITLFIKDSVTEAAKRKTLRFEHAIARADDQISNFYAPLTMLLVQLTEISNIKDKMTEADRNHAKNIEKLSYNVYFLEIHEKIINLMQNQMHLLEGDQIPDSFDDYYKHVASERVFYTLTGKVARAQEQNEFPADAIPVTFEPHPFPKDTLPKDIEAGFKAVLKRQEKLFLKLDKRRLYG